MQKREHYEVMQLQTGKRIGFAVVDMYRHGYFFLPSYSPYLALKLKASLNYGIRLQLPITK